MSGGDSRRPTERLQWGIKRISARKERIGIVEGVGGAKKSRRRSLRRRPSPKDQQAGQDEYTNGSGPVNASFTQSTTFFHRFFLSLMGLSLALECRRNRGERHHPCDRSGPLLPILSIQETHLVSPKHRAKSPGQRGSAPSARLCQSGQGAKKAEDGESAEAPQVAAIDSCWQRRGADGLS